MLAQAELASLAVAVRPTLGVVIVGVDGWREYTKPAIDSILHYEPGVHIVVVDAGSKRSYSGESDSMAFRAPEFGRLDVDYCRIDPSFSYAGAINKGLEFADADWTVVLNNDTLCTGGFADIVAGLSPTAIYGRQIIEERGERWIGLWIMAISRECREAVGPFDEAFHVCGFEDADFCLRAKALGFSSEWADLPFVHLWGKTRWGVPNYPEIRERNRLYFDKKWGWMPGIAMRVTKE